MSKTEQKGKTGADTEPSIWTSVFFSIIAVRFCITVISHCITSGNPLYVEKIGAPAYFGGILVASFMGASILMRIVSGALVDVYSRKAVIFSGSLFVLGGSLVALFAPSLAFNVVACVLQGIGFSMMHTAVTSATADVLPKKRLGEGISYAALGQALGMAIGPTLALWLIGFDFLNALALGTAVTATVAFILGFAIRYERDPKKLPKTAGYRVAWEARQRARAEVASAAQILEEQQGTVSVQIDGSSSGATITTKSTQKKLDRLFEKRALRGALPMLLVGIGVASFFNYAALFSKLMGYANPSIFFICSAAATIMIRLFFSRYFNTSNLRILFLIPVVCGIISFLGVCFIHNGLVFGFLGLGHGIGIGMAVPILNSVAVSSSPPARIGPANALFYLMYDMGTAIGALTWGFLYSIAGFTPVFIGAAICYSSAYVIALKTFPTTINEASSKFD